MNIYSRKKPRLVFPLSGKLRVTILCSLSIFSFRLFSVSFFLGFSAFAYRSSLLSALYSEGSPRALKGSAAKWRTSVRQSLALLGEILGEGIGGRAKSDCQRLVFDVSFARDTKAIGVYTGNRAIYTGKGGKSKIVSTTH